MEELCLAIKTPLICILWFYAILAPVIFVGKVCFDIGKK